MFFIKEWSQLTTDFRILTWIQGYRIPFQMRVFQNAVPKTRSWSPPELTTVSQIIATLLNKGVITNCSNSEAQFISDIFLEPKSSDGYRLILNLKKLNNFILTQHFKLEDWRTAAKLLSKDCFMCTIDLQDAYYLIPIAAQDRKYLRFVFDNKLFEFNCLPFGLSTAPFVFTKILKPVSAFLRNNGVRCTIYLDDFLIIADSFEECNRSVKFTCNTLEKLGFVINKEKSKLIPSTVCKYLGFIFNSRELQLELPVEKVNKIKVLVDRFLKLKYCTIREFAKFLGYLISCCPAVKYGWAHTKRMEREKYLSLLSNKDNYDAKMELPVKLSCDLQWWENNISAAKNSIKPLKFVREIFSDASLTGWGISCSSKRTHGFWNEEERLQPIHYLELKAAFFGLKCFTNQLKNCSILLRLDNTIAISYINRMGGIRFVNLNRLTREIWNWCEERQIFIFASYISSKENFEADYESRKLEPETEFSLNNDAFRQIETSFGIPEVDLFASRTNTKCKNYVSWYKDPNSIAVDAFTVSWTDYFFYAFPPFSIILRVLQKIRSDRATGIVVIPDWPSQPWYPLYHSMLSKGPIKFKPNVNLLTSLNRASHPLWRKLTLVSAVLSGERFN